MSKPIHPCHGNKESAACKALLKAEKTFRKVQPRPIKASDYIKAVSIYPTTAQDGKDVGTAFLKGVVRFARAAVCLATFYSICPKEKSVNELVKKVLRSADPGVRARAAWALGTIKDSKTVPALIRALKDNHAKPIPQK